MSTEDIYIAGRYNKLVRNLSQSPWIDKNDKRIKNSVQELIEHGLKEYLKFDKLVFSSSGREDVDVRMLGRGRPFCFRIQGLWDSNNDFNNETLAKIQAFINNQYSGQIYVRDLQITTKQEVTKNLKEGEESKTKEYRALCCCSKLVSRLEMEKLNNIAGLEIEQKTPIRVVHRRSISVRRRHIHKLKITKWDPANDLKVEFNSTQTKLLMEASQLESNELDRLFVLTLITEAGTYIKEFVHGDFGRTKPSLSSLLSNLNEEGKHECDTDLIELDVMVSKLISLSLSLSQEAQK